MKSLGESRGRTFRPARTVALLLAGPALAACVSFAHAAPAPLEGDSLLAVLVGEALARRPELAQAEASARAEQARVPQARALPDPVLSVGLQNDGFDGLQIGEMETSWWSVSAAQTFPWIGKRGLRGKAQALGARQSEADLDRARLTVRAEVERAWLDLALAREQLRILGRLEVLWDQAEGLSRARYESGSGAQSDILRAQLERSRLQQQRWALVAEERRRTAVLNRAAGRPLDAMVPPVGPLEDLADPALPDSAAAEADAEARSPELRRARLAVEQSAALVSLAKKEFFPDLTVSGGVMPRGGMFEPMWQAGVSMPIPLWAAGKQSRAVGEYRSRGEAARGGEEAVRRLLRQRLEERRALLAAQLRTNQIYRSGLLVQSEAAVSSAMTQYQVGRVPFATVLEALGGYFADLVGYRESIAAAHRLDIAQRELSLDPVPGAAGGFAAPSMPGTGGMGAPGAPAAGPAAAPAAAPTSTAMPRM